MPRRLVRTTEASSDTGRVPAAITELDGAWLETALRRAHPAARLHDFSAERIGADFGFASELHRLTLRGRALPAAVILKLWRAEDAGGLNEVRFYETYAPRMGASLARCFHARADAASGRGVLVLEDLSHLQQGDCLDLIGLPRALLLVHALAELHARWWRGDGVAPTDGLPPGLPADRGDAWYAERRTDFLQRFPGAMQGAGYQLLVQIEPRAALARQRLQTGPLTLLHRDLHLDNVLFAAAGGNAGGRPCIIDWASVGWGPPALDLAALVFELEDLRDEPAVTALYLATLRQRQPTVQVDTTTFRAELHAALLLRFGSATCGVARWLPGSARAHAVLVAAIERAGRLAAHAGATDPELFAVGAG